MSNTIDFLKQTKSLNSDTSSTNAESQSVKDKPSLFDSLLSSNKTTSEGNLNNTEEVDTKSKIEQKNSDTKVDVKNTKENQNSLTDTKMNSIDLSKNSNIENKSLLKEEKTSSTSSLLDRLVLEAKKEVKNLDTKVNTIQTVSQSSEKSQIINPEIKLNEVDESVKTNVENINSKSSLLDNNNLENTQLKEDSNNENKTLFKETKVSDNSSLLDIDNKTEVKIENKVDLNTLDTKSKLNKTETQTLNNLQDIKQNPTQAELNTLDINTKMNSIETQILNTIETKTNFTNNIATSLDNVETINENIKQEVKKIDNNVSKLLGEKEVKTLDSKLNTKEVLLEAIDNKIESNTSQDLLVPELKNKLTKTLTSEEAESLKSDISQISKNSDYVTMNKDSDLMNKDLIIELPAKNSDKEFDKLENILDSKKPLENKESDKAELNIDEKTLVIQKNETSTFNDDSEGDISNNSKINISSTISVPLSDNLNVEDNANSSKNIQAKSLMDQLIQKNNESIESIYPDKVNMIQRESASKDFITNIYLSAQKNSINTQNLFNKNEAINLLKESTNIKDVKTSAQMLDLGLEDVSVDQTVETKDSIITPKRFDIDLVAKKSILDNLMKDKNIVDLDVKNLITQSVEASNALLDDNLSLVDDAVVTVNSPLSYNIQSKIIGARQQMSTMMSDIARQMYENYKPPVTVFKINLNPLELGSIAILMKNDKNNSLSISMNVSNNSTLDALVDNQNILRTSLNKSFDENTKFNLNFSSSSENNSQSNSQSNQNNQGNQNRFEQQIDTQSILELKEENKDREEKSIDYM